MKHALAKTAETIGRLDFAFNNAGLEQTLTATADLTGQEWLRIIDVNLRGVFLCMKYEIPLMLRNGGGVIVNTSSGAVVKGFKDQAAYAAAKHGVIGLTRSAALEYASQNIRINAVCPGIIDTSMMDRGTGATSEGRQRVIGQEPVGRMGKPEEIAAAVVWLCSGHAAFAIGSAMVIDGGQTVCLCALLVVPFSTLRLFFLCCCMPASRRRGARTRLRRSDALAGDPAIRARPADRSG